MEVQADLRPMLGPNIVRLDPMRVEQIQNLDVYKAIDDLAKLSSQAMNLRQPLTSCQKLITSENTVYLMWEYDEEKEVSRLLGFCKVGRKTLFLMDNDMVTYEGTLLCLLEFYVHYKVQRRGYGKRIINAMLHDEHAEAYQLALDNPTVTLLGFMSEKFGLTHPIWQNTNFVVYPQLFDSVRGQFKDDLRAPEGWNRPQTPRRIVGGGATAIRWLEHAIPGHQAKGQATSVPVDADQTVEGTLANRAHQAKARKNHILSSKPLW